VGLLEEISAANHAQTPAATPRLLRKIGALSFLSFSYASLDNTIAQMNFVKLDSAQHWSMRKHEKLGDDTLTTPG